MDTLEIAVLAGFCLKIALAIVALVVVFKMKLPSSMGTKELQSEGDQQEESLREEKPKSRPVAKSSSGRGIHKRAVSSGKRPLKSKPASNEARKQAQTQNTAPVKSAEQRVALKNESVKLPPPSGVPQGQSAITKPKSVEQPPRETSAGDTRGGENKRTNGITLPTRNKAGQTIERDEVRKQAQPKNTAPVKSSEPRVTLKNDSIKHTTFVGPPQPQAAFTVSRSGGKPPRESLAGNTSGVKSNELLTNAEFTGAPIDKREASMDKRSGTEDKQASSEQPAAITDSGEDDKETPQTEKSGLGDLADLFATSATDFSEKSKLSEQVKEVDISDILSEGLGLLGKVKKSKE